MTTFDAETAQYEDLAPFINRLAERQAKVDQLTASGQEIPSGLELTDAELTQALIASRRLYRPPEKRKRKASEPTPLSTFNDLFKV